MESSSSEWYKNIRDFFTSYDRDTPQYYRGLWRKTFDTEAYRELFEEKVEQSVKWEVGMTEDQVLNRTLSKSYLTPKFLSGRDREEFIQGMKERMRAPGVKWVDQEVRRFSCSLVPPLGFARCLILMSERNIQVRVLHRRGGRQEKGMNRPYESSAMQNAGVSEATPDSHRSPHATSTDPRICSL